MIMTICGISLTAIPLGMAVPPHKQSGSLHLDVVHLVAVDNRAGVGYTGSGREGGADEPFFGRFCLRFSLVAVCLLRLWSGVGAGVVVVVVVVVGFKSPLK